MNVEEILSQLTVSVDTGLTEFIQSVCESIPYVGKSTQDQRFEILFPTDLSEITLAENCRIVESNETNKLVFVLENKQTSHNDDYEGFVISRTTGRNLTVGLGQRQQWHPYFVQSIGGRYSIGANLSQFRLRYVEHLQRIYISKFPECRCRKKSTYHVDITDKLFDGINNRELVVPLSFAAGVNQSHPLIQNEGPNSKFHLLKPDLSEVKCYTTRLDSEATNWLLDCFDKSVQTRICNFKAVQLVDFLTKTCYPFLIAAQNTPFPASSRDIGAAIEDVQYFDRTKHWKYPDEIRVEVDVDKVDCFACPKIHGEALNISAVWSKDKKCPSDIEFTDGTEHYEITGLRQRFFRRTKSAVLRTFLTPALPCQEPADFRALLGFSPRDLLWKAFQSIGTVNVGSLQNLAIKALVIIGLTHWLSLPESKFTLRLCWHRFRFHYLDPKTGLWSKIIPRTILERIIEVRESQLRELCWTSLASRTEHPSEIPNHLDTFSKIQRAIDKIKRSDSRLPFSDLTIDAVLFSHFGRFY